MLTPLAFGDDPPKRTAAGVSSRRSTTSSNAAEPPSSSAPNSARYDSAPVTSSRETKGSAISDRNNRTLSPPLGCAPSTGEYPQAKPPPPESPASAPNPTNLRRTALRPMPRGFTGNNNLSTSCQPFSGSPDQRTSAQVLRCRRARCAEALGSGRSHDQVDDLARAIDELLHLAARQELHHGVFGQRRVAGDGFRSVLAQHHPSPHLALNLDGQLHLIVFAKR